MTEAFICDAVRTPIGRYGGVLAVSKVDIEVGKGQIVAQTRDHSVDGVLGIHRRSPVSVDRAEIAGTGVAVAFQITREILDDALVEALVVVFQALLPADECEALAQLEEEVLQLLDQVEVLQ